MSIDPVRPKPRHRRCNAPGSGWIQTPIGLAWSSRGLFRARAGVSVRMCYSVRTRVGILVSNPSYLHGHPVVCFELALVYRCGCATVYGQGRVSRAGVVCPASNWLVPVYCIKGPCLITSVTCERGSSCMYKQGLVQPRRCIITAKAVHC
jgi:hypothetical protein